jgi:hypothetical protein
MVWTQDTRLGKEQIWSGKRMRRLEGCRNVLEVGWAVEIVWTQNRRLVGQ